MYTLASVRNVSNGFVFETGKYYEWSPPAVVESRDRLTDGLGWVVRPAARQMF
jgi:hypothetical protein